MAHLTGVNEGENGIHSVLNGNGRIDTVDVEEVNVVRLEVRKVLLNRLLNIFRVAAASPVIAVFGGAEFRCEENLETVEG